MKCIHCKSESTGKATLILDAGAKWRVLYCGECECIQRIGDSVPGAKGSYRGSFIRKFEDKKKGGEKP